MPDAGPDPPVLIALAGSNGAGKSTFFNGMLREMGLPFVNADILARELGLGPYEAARVADDLRRSMLGRARSFVMETVFSDPIGAKLDLLEEAANLGYAVTLLFFGLDSPELSARRVAARVGAGGHDVPADKIHARYGRTLDNLVRAIPRLPRIVVFDNSSYDHPYRLLGEFHGGIFKPAAAPLRIRWFDGVLARIRRP